MRLWVLIALACLPLCSQARFHPYHRYASHARYFSPRFPVFHTWVHPHNRQQPLQPVQPVAITDPQSCTCGRRNYGAPHRIVGGHEARVNEFPWKVALLNQKGRFFCTASLIHPRYVLTAAHCTEGARNRGWRIIIASVGDHDLQSNSETSSQCIRVKRVIQHKSYNSITTDNDIALLELSKDAQLSNNVSPVCLPYKYRGTTFSNGTVTASGWGDSKFRGNDSGRKLVDVDLDLISNEQCSEMYREKVEITGNMLCTYTHGDGKGKDTCVGDSGGSIDYSDPETNNNFAIGLVSFGTECAHEKYPGVYTRVTNYLDWIEANTGRTFCGKE